MQTEYLKDSTEYNKFNNVVNNEATLSGSEFSPETKKALKIANFVLYSFQSLAGMVLTGAGVALAVTGVAMIPGIIMTVIGISWMINARTFYEKQDHLLSKNHFELVKKEIIV